jgi:hypothetical protein
LIVPSLLVKTYPSPADDVQAVFRIESKGTGLRPEKNGPDLAGIIFERKIEVTRRGNTEVRDFTFYPNIRKLLFQKALDLTRQFSDGENIPQREFRTGIHRTSWNDLVSSGNERPSFANHSYYNQ